MQIKRWQRLGLLASLIWVIVSGLFASRNETWLAAWKLYCSFAADSKCAGATVILVVHRGAIAGIVILPLVLAWLIAGGLRRIRASRRGV